MFQSDLERLGTGRQEFYEVQRGEIQSSASQRDKHQHILGGGHQGKAGKNLGVLVDTELNMSHQQGPWHPERPEG